MRERSIVVPDFFDQAEPMREDFDRHFASPHGQSSQVHQVWNYWYVPGVYTYMRTLPHKVLQQPLVDAFLQRLRTWTADTLGLSVVSYPYLSLYVDGCGQGIHNDSRNGCWGYVYSLTRWEARRFLGGETMVFFDTNYWETERFTQAGAGTNFYDLVPSRFNQLLVFDDRLLHAVPFIQGSMDPREGRVVLNGHVTGGGPVVRGSLTREQVGDSHGVEMVSQVHEKFGKGYHGHVTVRLDVDADGRATAPEVLSDRLFRVGTQGEPAERVVEAIAEMAAQRSFPESGGASRVTIPVLFGQ